MKAMFSQTGHWIHEETVAVGNWYRRHNQGVRNIILYIMVALGLVIFIALFIALASWLGNGVGSAPSHEFNPFYWSPIGF